MIKKLTLLLFSCSLATAQSEPPIAIVIASYNNNRIFMDDKLYKKNLDSIFSQEYDNYRIIYIDDHSTDNTAEAVLRYAKDKNQAERLTLVKNKKRWGPCRNRYVGCHLCKDEEIVCILDGDDWFPHNHVLKTVAQQYQNPNVWLTYSQFQTIPNNTLSGGKPTPPSVIKNHAYREFGWYYHSLKTFYAWLFKQVRLQDLLHEGSFFSAASDLAEMFPMVEMSGGRFVFISDILYHASQHLQNEIHTQGREFMARMGDIIIHQMQPYKALSEPILATTQIPPRIKTVPATYKLSLQRIKRNNATYVLVTRDGLTPSKQDLDSALQALWATGATAFHFDLPTADIIDSTNLLDITGVLPERTVYAFQYAHSTCSIPDENYKNSLYRISDITTQGADELFIEIATYLKESTNIGLFFAN